MNVNVLCIVNSMLTKVLRQAIAAYPSRNLLARESGVDKGAISRFVNGHSTLTLETVDKLVPVLGLKLVDEKQGRRPRKR
ncbi:MAG: helix-turn-helix domain-containing protein [Planctomycetota bacterium JB042]